jgi:hypothetical protein
MDDAMSCGVVANGAEEEWNSPLFHFGKLSREIRYQQIPKAGIQCGTGKDEE